MIGAWPITPERLKDYMQKATREAKQKTTWTSNNAEFEDALQNFIGAVMQHDRFLAELESFVGLLEDAGRVNSLAQTLLKHTSPGVPDLYQGAEVWDLSLVDPDNRRPVDYRLRAKLLHEIKRMPAEKAAEEAMHRADDGLPKMWTIHRALCLRRERPESFGANAAYAPLTVMGPKANHAIAYLRGTDVATVVPRFVRILDNQWQQTTVSLPEGSWTHRLTGASVAGGSVPINEVLRDFPVALLVKD
jgi:(1->4)-alpha-D-glucan 1-alpha-D-glucosylmutase